MELSRLGEKSRSEQRMHCVTVCIVECMVLQCIYFYRVRKVGGRKIARRIIKGRILGERKTGRAHDRYGA